MSATIRSGSLINPPEAAYQHGRYKRRLQLTDASAGLFSEYEGDRLVGENLSLLDEVTNNLKFAVAPVVDRNGDAKIVARDRARAAMVIAPQPILDQIAAVDGPHQHLRGKILAEDSFRRARTLVQNAGAASGPHVRSDKVWTGVRQY